MPFPFALLRTIILSFIVVTNVILLILSALTFHQKSGGAFQALTISYTILNLFVIVGCLCHQYTSQDEETTNTRNLGLFGFCSLLGLALAVTLTTRASQDRGVGLCNDFANTGNSCVPAGVQLGMAYTDVLLALIGFIVSWIDKYPGAVEVTPRYPITKAPSSHYAAHGQELDGNFTHPPVRQASRTRKNSEWSDVPIC